MNACEIEVVKLGGSLLSRGSFVPELRRFLQTSQTLPPTSHRVWIVGGGPLVDILRTFDATESLGSEEAHWRAIELMQISGRVVSAWLPELQVVDSFLGLKQLCAVPGQSLFLPLKFLRDNEPMLPGGVLERSWQVTSDSIAARIAVCLGATRLRLIKSRCPAGLEATDWNVAAREGLVDGFFPQLVGDLREANCEILITAWDTNEGDSYAARVNH